MVSLLHNTLYQPPLSPTPSQIHLIPPSLTPNHPSSHHKSFPPFPSPLSQTMITRSYPLPLQPTPASLNILDSPDFTKEEVHFTLLHFKGQKVHGENGISSELVLQGGQTSRVFSHILHLFPHCYTFPISWNKGMMTTIFEKEDPLICSNYRTIAVCVIFSELYTSLLEKCHSYWT